MTNKIQAGGHPDLLSSVYSIQIKNEEKISEDDRQYCERQQQALNETIHQLKWWYELFKANGVRYQESHKVSYEANGIVKSRESYSVYSEDKDHYKRHEFLPFESLNKVVEQYQRTVHSFARRIISYFNEKYNLSVPDPDIDEKTLPFGFLPKYQSYVDQVIAHLGGKGFRETAEEELLARFIEVVRPYRRDTVKPELKGNTISFPRAVRYKDYSWDDDSKISWSNVSNFNHFCAGIFFGIFGLLNGNYGQITDFDPDKVDFTRTYDLTVGGAATMKLFKNGRVDIKFKEKKFADSFFKTLKLDKLEIPKEED